jgi:hypothetical protein
MNRIVVSRIALILIAIGVVMHCLPVQRCVVERLAFGANCHGEDSAQSGCESGNPLTDADGLGYVATDNHSHGSCICEAPNAPADRSTVHASVPLDLADLKVVDPILSAMSLDTGVSRASSEVAQTSPPVGFVLPLLI